MRTIKYTVEPDFQCLEDLHETSSELTLVHIGREKCQPYHVFAGTRDEYIIHLILSGHGFYSEQGNTWPLSGGQMFLVHPHEEIVYCADSRDPWSYVWFGFKGSRVESLLKQCGFSKSRCVLAAPDPSVYLPCFDEAFAHIGLKASDSLYRESILLRLLSLLTSAREEHPSELSGEDEASGKSSYVTQAVDLIQTAYSQGITVSDIAERLGISRPHLTRIFQEELHLSVQTFLINIRMQAAADLLKNTALPVKEITQQVGYTDALVFSKQFKKRFGLSPTHYREYQDEMELRQKRFE